MTVSSRGNGKNQKLIDARLRRTSASGAPWTPQDVADQMNEFLWEQHQQAKGSPAPTTLDHRYVSGYEAGRHWWPSKQYRAAWRHVLRVETDAELGFTPKRRRRGPSTPHTQPSNAAGGLSAAPPQPARHLTDLPNHDYALALGTDDDDGLEALELARRAGVSDVSTALPRLETAVDELAMAYAATPPANLLRRVRLCLRYLASLLDKRMTLGEHRRLLAAGAWLSLLAATLRIDLRQRRAGDANLTTALELAQQAERREIEAWCWETRAWEVLTTGDFARAVELSQRAQAMAPKGSSVLIQATAQEGRAWARMGRGDETRDALTRVERLVSPLRRPERPEHHYQYDPAKALSYTATTLAWVKDSGAEDYARTAITELENANDGVVRPRRIASARLDLGLALLAAEKPDEAADAGVKAITSGRIVASNWWRATEVLHGVEEAAIGQAADLRDAYQTFKPHSDDPA